MNKERTKRGQQRTQRTKVGAESFSKPLVTNLIPPSVTLRSYLSLRFPVHHLRGLSVLRSCRYPSGPPFVAPTGGTRSGPEWSGNRETTEPNRFNV